MTSEIKGQPAAALTRRSFISMGSKAALGTLLVPAVASPVMAAVFSQGKVTRGARRVSFRNQHTGETFSGVYRVGDKYLPDAFDQINVVLRDFRSNESFPIDPRVIDIIYTVHEMTGHSEPYEVLSGYRCPKTNAMLREVGGGVAKNSLHMTGQAIDLRMKGFSTTRIRDLAKGLKAGGVGYYAKSDFVHMDCGDVRHW
jgi:uncharacterized protein YcbK (DUF882 family)